jgi:hypothetical protein
MFLKAAIKMLSNHGISVPIAASIFRVSISISISNSDETIENELENGIGSQ